MIKAGVVCVVIAMLLGVVLLVTSCGGSADTVGDGGSVDASRYCWTVAPYSLKTEICAYTSEARKCVNDCRTPQNGLVNTATLTCVKVNCSEGLTITDGG